MPSLHSPVASAGALAQAPEAAVARAMPSGMSNFFTRCLLCLVWKLATGERARLYPALWRQASYADRPRGRTFPGLRTVTPFIARPAHPC